MKAFLIAVFLVLAGFGLYYGITKSRPFRRWATFPEGGTRPRGIYMGRILGVAFFAGLPLLIHLLFFPLEGLRFYLGNLYQPAILYWLLALGIILIPLNFIIGSKKKTLSQYPQIRKSEWSVFTLLFSALSWVAYLFAYEWLFRGLLFFSSLKIMGLIPAILVNISLYSLVHIPKGKEEVIGALPLGIVLCIATYHTGSIWVAVIAHAILALTNEWVTLHHHPKIGMRW